MQKFKWVSKLERKITLVRHCPHNYVFNQFSLKTKSMSFSLICFSVHLQMTEKFHEMQLPSVIFKSPNFFITKLLIINIKIFKFETIEQRFTINLHWTLQTFIILICVRLQVKWLTPGLNSNSFLGVRMFSGRLSTWTYKVSAPLVYISGCLIKTFCFFFLLFSVWLHIVKRNRTN